jgi:hypothetical protein
MTTNPRAEAVAQLTEAVKASRNGLPALAHAIDAISAAPSSAKTDADAVLLASCVTRTLGQLHALVTIGSLSGEWKEASDDTLLRDLPGMRPRENLELLILRALEPPASTFGAILALFKGGLSLPFVADMKVLAKEMVDGITIGEVRRRANV